MAVVVDTVAVPLVVVVVLLLTVAAVDTIVVVFVADVVAFVTVSVVLLAVVLDNVVVLVAGVGVLGAIHVLHKTGQLDCIATWNGGVVHIALRPLQPGGSNRSLHFNSGVNDVVVVAVVAVVAASVAVVVLFVDIIVAIVFVTSLLVTVGRVVVVSVKLHVLH